MLLGLALRPANGNIAFLAAETELALFAHHLLWLQELVAEDVAVELLGPSTVVRLADGGVR
ncbi:hypothetical protein ABZ876_35460 [Streptomyces sp. NPDC046931]|uniref:hypothetical protein n=1 Tax=Streptomyces sp. NPDC046931 TaxID=3154806 RepID=UPI0033D38276